MKEAQITKTRPVHSQSGSSGGRTPKPDISALGAELDYEEEWIKWDDMKKYGPMSRHTRRLIWNLIGDLPFRSVLDVGCGQGSPLEEVARRRSGVELVGVDFSPKAVDMAQRLMPQAE